ncbi:MAG: lipoyl synthase [Clostridia bacterium]|nr:lipoyl synthase [Clostridia bacterium]
MQGKPEWLKIKITNPAERARVEALLKELNLHTVCEEANCPNLMECFAHGTATFMILGSVCMRCCTFCAVQKGKPSGVDADEPRHIAEAVKELRLKHAVITTVTRDDLEAGGARQFAQVIREIRASSAGTTVEVLISDLGGDDTALRAIVDAKPDILGHNVETVPRLYTGVRPKAVYERSLALIGRVSQLDKGILTKSGIMTGLGETHDEVLEVFGHLREAGCDLLTVGQYLAPSKSHHPVVEFTTPEEFKQYESEAYALGFQFVASGPLVRSSYRAEEALGRPV